MKNADQQPQKARSRTYADCSPEIELLGCATQSEPRQLLAIRVTHSHCKQRNKSAMKAREQENARGEETKQEALDFGPNKTRMQLNSDERTENG